ncbi:unnamed protein product [Musa acuminata subsp. malaccensis]|uniref:Dynein light chain n=1 Tax=Musa acuminata subsp. malaccensis TaxID=214687 RepID=A0A804IFM9_MUSAM|nr:unnamed protein product [Musa acuminata subsp. malaccensis]
MRLAQHICFAWQRVLAIHDGESRAVIGVTDMLQRLQQDALRLAGKALVDLFDITEATEIARFIKKEFDGSYRAGWQYMVGTHFGSFATCHNGYFIYLSIGSLAIVLLGGAPDAEADKSHFISLESVRVSCTCLCIHSGGGR